MNRSAAKCASFLMAACLCAMIADPVRALDWPQWLGPNRDGVWRETGLLARFPAGGPKVLWRTPVGTGYSGPAVADGRVYVMDRQRAVDANGKPRRPTRDGIPGNERILCLNAADGKLVWKHEYVCPYDLLSQRAAYHAVGSPGPSLHARRHGRSPLSGAHDREDPLGEEPSEG